MCFSATGSFALSGVLAGIGVVGVTRNAHKPHRAFAAMPLLFAAQQATEGVVWLTFPPSEHVLLHRAATLAFIGIAMVFWPTWVALSLRIGERDAAHRRVLNGFVVAGVIASLWSAVILLRTPPIASIAGHSIRYDSPSIGNHFVEILLLVGYLVPTIGPFFASTLGAARTIGATLVVSLALTMVVERETLTSVWCFFAATLSVQTLWALENERRTIAKTRVMGVARASVHA